MYQIKTMNKISQAGLSQFDTSKYSYSDDAPNPAGILVRSAKLHDYAFNPELLCIARAGAGVNNIPVEKCAEQGIVVFNTPGANANAVKELVLCALLMSSRKVYSGITWTKGLHGNGDQVPAMIEKGKSAFAGPEIKGKKLGVIGLGAIGVMVANAAQHLGMEVYGYDPYISIDAAWGLSRSVTHAMDLKTIYDNCDYITLHVPATGETSGMINAEAIEMMKPGVRIINFARSELVVLEDLLEAVKGGKVSAYITDFGDDRLLEQENILVMPHLGASTPESEDNCARMAVQEMVDFIERGVIRNSVNFPNMDMDRGGKYRICVLHKNVPKMIRGVVNIFSEADINIENMENRAKKDYACTLLDTDSEPSEELLEKIRGIDNIIHVRLIK